MPYKHLPSIERLLDEVENVGHCWIWTGRLNDSGYATIGGLLVHRLVFEYLVGPIPPGLQLDHFFCDDRQCVHPRHVRPATSRENTLRGETIAAKNLAKEACPAGHAYDPKNTYTDPSGGRHCRSCMRAASRRWYSRKQTRT